AHRVAAETEILDQQIGYHGQCGVKIADLSRPVQLAADGQGILLGNARQGAQLKLVEADTQGRPRTVFFTVDLEKLLSVGETDVPGVKTGIVQKKAIVGLHGPFLVIEQKGSRMEAENIGIGG